MPRLTDLGNGTGYYAKGGIRETNLVNRIVKALSLRGGFVRKFHGGHYQRAGIPDLYYQENGMCIWLEVKVEGGDTTAMQKLNLEELDKQGAYVGVITSVNGAIQAVEAAKEHHQYMTKGRIKYVGNPSQD